MIDKGWLEESSDPDEAAELTSQLVATPSYPGEEGAAQYAVADWLRAYGLDPQLQETDGSKDRPNILARVENGSGPTLLLNGHIDTVPAVDGWDLDPWEGWRQGDRLYGLGTCDMKSGIAAAMLATRALASRRDLWHGTVIFTSVVDEEAYSLGARTLINSGLAADMCIVTEPNWSAPSLGSCGKLLVRADVTGRAAHAAWPQDGINAAIEAARFVARVNDELMPNHPTMTASQCVLSIHGGNQQYVMTVPEHARVLINRQLVPGESEETVLEQMRALVDTLETDAGIEFAAETPYYPPWEIAIDHPFVERFAEAYAAEADHRPTYGYRGFGDANLFAGQLRIPTIQFGPHGDRFHQANEWVSIASIAASVRVLLRLATQVLPT